MILGIALLAALLGVTGCGGHSSAQPFAGSKLLGTWLDVAPYSTPGDVGDGDGQWPTRTLTVTDDGHFSVEEYAPERTVTGPCAVNGNEFTFGTDSATGGASWLPTFTFALSGDVLGLTGPAPEGERTLRLAAVQHTVPPALCTVWLLTALHDAAGNALPLVSSTRLEIDTDGSVILTRCGDGVLRQQRGTLLVTGGHLGLRLPASGTVPGRLVLLGAPVINSGQLQLSAPDNRGVAIYEPFSAPDTSLLGTWTHPVQGGTAITLAINPDGTYAYTGGFQQSGTWRSYQNSHLCLSTATVQRTIAWGYKDAAATTLVLGEWNLTDPAHPAFATSTWTRGT